MGKCFSIYLDVLRVLAAVVVFLSHVGHGHLVGGPLWRFTFWGHEAVMLFFVLSGYVIAYVADTREHTLKDYAVARLARLYSVIVPTMVLTLLFDGVGRWLAPASYTSAGVVDAVVAPWLGYVLSLLMLNQSWGLATHFGSNGAYWSIPFEFWYYVLFGAVFFLRGTWRWVVLVLAALLAGPRIGALLPVWLMGVGLYRYRHVGLRTHRTLVLLAALLGLLVTLLMFWWDVRHMGDGTLLGVAINGWAWDMCLGLAITLHLWGVQGVLTVQSRQALPQWAHTILQRMAGSTLALYLLHLPLIGLLNAMAYHWGKNGGWQLVLLLVPLVFALTVGYWLEQQKHLWRGWFKVVLSGWGKP